MLLKKYKNRLFLLLSELGLKATEFEKIEKNNEFSLTHKSTEFEFVIWTDEENYHNFNVGFTQYSPGNPLCEYGAGNFGMVESYFRSWVSDELNEILEENSGIDMWNQTKNIAKLGTIEEIDFDDNSPFSSQEKNQLKLGIAEAKILISTEFEFEPAQIELIHKRFEYLEIAIERNNKTDWKGIAISTIIGLILNLGVDTNTGNTIWDLFIKVFQNLPSLPIP